MLIGWRIGKVLDDVIGLAPVHKENANEFASFQGVALLGLVLSLCEVKFGDRGYV